MGLRLSTISDADAANGLSRAEADLARWEEAGPDPADRRGPAEAPRYYEVLSDAYFRAAGLAHQQQRPAEHVFHYLHYAGLRSLEMLEGRGDPVASTNRDYYAMIDRFLAAIAWCADPGARSRLGSLPECRYHWPHDPKWTYVRGSREVPRLLHGYYRVEYMRVATRTLVSGSVDVPRVQELIRELDGDDRHVPERVESSHCYWALMAIADRNSGFFIQTLAQLIELHRGEAVGGRYRTKPEGLLAMNALFLVRLAREAGMTLGHRSDYLPVFAFQ